MAKMGRPQKEIAYFFDCSIDTLNRACQRKHKCTFAEYYKRYLSNGRISLRRNMYRLSKKSTAMAIFLSKQKIILGYTDRTEVSTGENASIQLSYKIDEPNKDKID